MLRVGRGGVQLCDRVCVWASVFLPTRPTTLFYDFGESPTANRCRTSRGDVTTAASFFANQPLYMRSSFLGVDSSSEVAVGAFKLEGSDCSRARQGVQTRACRPCGKRSTNLSSGPCLELLLVEVHLLLGFVLADGVA